MSTTLKEWLKQKIASMEATRDEIPFGLDEEDSNTLVALRIALASFETEPVMYLSRQNTTLREQFGTCDDWEINARLVEADFPAVEIPDSDNYEFMPLYTAPPAPVVPEEITADGIIDMHECGFVEGWNACRAAMLQGADGNSPVIPDGWVMVPIEPTPDMREAYHQAQAEYEDSDGLWSPDHQWQAMLAAAPQQEGK